MKEDVTNDNTLPQLSDAEKELGSANWRTNCSLEVYGQKNITNDAHFASTISKYQAASPCDKGTLEVRNSFAGESRVDETEIWTRVQQCNMKNSLLC